MPFDIENPAEEALDPLNEGDDPALQAENERALAEKAVRLQMFQQMICDRRKEAVSARVASGVERRWLDDLDAYHGRDSATKRNDLMDVAGGYAQNTRQGSAGDTQASNRSTVFVQVTRQKTNAAASRVADMLYPTDDKNWGIKPTPVPTLMQAAQNKASPPVMENGQPLPHPNVPGQNLTYADLAAEQLQQAQEKAKLMETEIDDQLTECQFNYEGRKVLQDAAMLGTGVLKGPAVRSKVNKKWSPRTTVDPVTKKTKTVQVLELAEVIEPESYRVDPWNFYPDPGCGENIQEGSYVFERGYIPGRELIKLTKVPGYNAVAIMQCLQEGPQRVHGEEGSYSDQQRAAGLAYDRSGAYDDKRFELWTYTGDVTRDDLELVGVDLPDDMEGWMTHFSGVLVMCNNRIIKAMLNPLDSGDFPYDVYVWERVALSPFGVGVPYLMRYAQRTLNAAWRAMLDNMALSSGPQIIMNRKAVVPADGNWQLTARKIWHMAGDADDVQKAMMVFEVPSHQQEISNIIDIAQKFADEETSLPQIAQGEKGSAPDTVGGMSILMNSANTVLRRLVKQFDDMVTRPHIRRYYDWNMQYNPKEEIKGDFEIDARGSSVLVVRDQQQQAVMQLFELAASPVFGVYVDPMKLFKKGLEMNHLTPDDVMRTPEEIAQKQKEMEQAAPPDPRIQAAQIQAQARLEEAKISTQGEQAYIASQAQIARDDHAATMGELQMKRELAILQYANQNGMQLMQIKADLAQLAMKLQSDHAMKNAEAMTRATQQSGPADAATPTQSPDKALQ